MTENSTALPKVGERLMRVITSTYNGCSDDEPRPCVVIFVNKATRSSIILAGVLESGDVYTSYYETPMADKLLIAGIINQDAMMDNLIANGYIEEEDDSDDEEDNDDG